METRETVESTVRLTKGRDTESALFIKGSVKKKDNILPCFDALSYPVTALFFSFWGLKKFV